MYRRARELERYLVFVHGAPSRTSMAGSDTCSSVSWTTSPEDVSEWATFILDVWKCRDCRVSWLNAL